MMIQTPWLLRSILYCLHVNIEIADSTKLQTTKHAYTLYATNIKFSHVLFLHSNGDQAN